MNLTSPASSSVSSMTFSPFSERRSSSSSCKKSRRTNRSLGGGRSSIGEQQQRPLQCRGCEEFLLPQAFAKPQRTKGTGLATCRQCVWKEMLNHTTTNNTPAAAPPQSTQCSPTQQHHPDSPDVHKLCPTDTLDTVASSLNDDDDDNHGEEDDVSSLAATRSLGTTRTSTNRNILHFIPVSPNADC